MIDDGRNHGTGNGVKHSFWHMVGIGWVDFLQESLAMSFGEECMCRMI